MANRNLLRLGNWLLAFTAFLAGLGLLWEYGAVQYWRGLAHAIVPVEATPEEKVEAILTWMSNWPARTGATTASALPQDAVMRFCGLQYPSDCGAAKNVIVNLAAASGLRARRLLLLNPERKTKHVAAEVLLGERWVVVDGLNHGVLRDASGRALTREELADPEIFQQAVSRLPSYNPDYTFERTANVRVEKIPLLGSVLRRVLDRVVPGWEGALAETLLLDRPSRKFAAFAVLLFLLAAAARGAITWRLQRHARAMYQVKPAPAE
ncbi:MAG: hypothetical protein K6U09_05565 [Acidobacteriia bacterium]|nr:hypothetical protein [Terriglobia bacterium]